MNDPAYEALQNLDLPGIYPIRLRDFEEGDAPLAVAKSNRGLIEYYFTCTPSLPLYILRENPSVEMITYLDSDLFFFSDPAVLFDEFGDNSVGIIGHRFPPALKASEVFGLYNVGFLIFRRDAAGMACLNWWRDRCNEWCYDHLDNGRFADQKYLDSWARMFPGVVELRHKGANLAPWNLANYRITRKDGKVMVDEQELIFFHFHGFKPITRIVYTLNFEDYQIHATQPIVRNIYAPYALARRRSLWRHRSWAITPTNGACAPRLGATASGTASWPPQRDGAAEHPGPRPDPPRSGRHLPRKVDLTRLTSRRLGAISSHEKSAQPKRAAASVAVAIRVLNLENQTTHTEVGADYPKEMHPTSGAPAVFAWPMHAAPQKRRRSPGRPAALADAPDLRVYKKSMLPCIGSGA